MCIENTNEMEARQEMKAKVMAMITNGAKTFINDHNGREECLQAVVILENDYVCPVGLYSLWSLNKLYVGKDEKIHLSTYSVAGVFGECATLTDGTSESFMKSAITKYDQCEDRKRDLGISTKRITSYVVL